MPKVLLRLQNEGKAESHFANGRFFEEEDAPKETMP